MDIMLPKYTGFEVCQMIREFSDVPVVMLTAKGDDMDKILGLEYGADDYITKPFQYIGSKGTYQNNGPPHGQKCKKKEDKNIILKNDMKIDRQSRRVYVDGKEINLTAKEFGCWNFWRQIRIKKKCSRRELLNIVWGYEYPGRCENS